MCARNSGSQYASSLTDANGKSDTTVYTIAYGAPNSGCASDAKSKSNPAGTNLTPCQTMAQMATSPVTFFSDATATQNKGAVHFAEQHAANQWKRRAGRNLQSDSDAAHACPIDCEQPIQLIKST